MLRVGLNDSRVSARVLTLAPGRRLGVLILPCIFAQLGSEAALAQVAPPPTGVPEAREPAVPDGSAPPAAPAPIAEPETGAGRAMAVPPAPSSEASAIPPDASVEPGRRMAAPAAPVPAPTSRTDELRPWSGIRVGGFIQGQFQASRFSEDQLQSNGAPVNQDRFLVRRARVRFDRDWRWASAALELDANTVRGVGVGIRRAEAAVVYRGSEDDRAAPLIALSVGVMDIPFGHELLESARTRFFMERSLGSAALFPTDPDVGAKVGGKLGFFRYGVALMNGEPLDDRGFPRDPNAAKDAIGRVGVEVKPIPALTVLGGASFARGTGFHAGQQATKDSVVWRDLDDDGAVSGIGELVAVRGTPATPSKNFPRWAFALDLGISVVTPLGTSKIYGEAFLASNYDRGLIAADPVARGFNLRHAGGAIAAVQDVTPYGVVGLRASFYDPISDLIDGSRGSAVPPSRAIVTLSPLAGFVLRDQARLLFQYDLTIGPRGRHAPFVPAEARNDRFTARLQVEL